MGGPNFLRELLKDQRKEEEIILMGPEDLRFHLSWDWIMPIWKKVRKEILSSDSHGAMLFALSRAIDDVDLTVFHNLLSNWCINWCQRKQIKL